VVLVVVVVDEVVEVVSMVEVVVELAVVADVAEEVVDGVSPVDVEAVLVSVVGDFGAGRLRANHIPPIPCPLISPGL